MAKVKESIVQYGHTTSVKGVSKAVKSTKFTLRILWLVAFCIGAAAGTYQITVLFIKFFSHSTYTSISVCNGCHPPFPEVTLCSLNPINLLDEFEGHVLQLDDYLEFVESSLEVNDTEKVFGTSDFKLLAEVYGWMYSLQGYFQNIYPLDVLDILAYAEFKKTLVQKCFWYDWNDNEYEKENCKEMSNYYFFTDEFFICTTLHLNESNSASKRDEVKSLQALLFLNDFSEQLMPFYSPHIQRSAAKGVRLSIHPPNTLPEVGKGINIPPGHEVKIALKATKMTHEPYPYSDCREEPEPLEDNELHDAAKMFDWLVVDYNYSHTSAASICKQEKVIEECGCYSSTLPFTFKTASKYPDISGCNDMGVFDILLEGEEQDEDVFRDIVENIDCLTSKINIDLLDDECADTPTCEQYEYDYQISQSTWPHESYVLTFYCDELRQPNCDNAEDLEDIPLGEAFAEYENILQLMVTNSTLAWQELRKLDLITRNFIDLKIMFDHPQLIELIDKPTLTVEQLFGSLGGLFNLWIGITFFTLIELVEVCCVICSSCKCCAKDGLDMPEDKDDIIKVAPQASFVNTGSDRPTSDSKTNSGNTETVLEDIESLPRVQ